ncbi:MAG: uracil-DNA glycosylase [Alphaproteobacteria bacterium]|nr:uracil-DNA glycosylase [Alphaproteobacteria bacterium]
MPTGNRSAAAQGTAPAAPGRDCPACPRLADFRAGSRRAEPAWHNAPVPSFGALDVPLLIVGLAPGLRGANRTGRPFTGDYAGDLLYATLAALGLADGTYGARADDGFALRGCRVTNAVRCVPPENKPTGDEIRACNGFLAAELAAMPRLRAVLALGSVAHGAVLAALGLTKSRFKFAHGARHAIGGGRTLVDSYHCSRYNTSTKVLTPAMFGDAVRIARDLARG